MRQVKLFESKNTERIEREVNALLRNVSEISVSYQAVYTNGGTLYSAMVVYNYELPKE